MLDFDYVLVYVVLEMMLYFYYLVVESYDGYSDDIIVANRVTYEVNYADVLI